MALQPLLGIVRPRMNREQFAPIGDKKDNQLSEDNGPEEVSLQFLISRCGHIISREMMPAARSLRADWGLVILLSLF